jgi:hypothetical protein
MREKRLSRRIDVHIEAEITFGGKTYAGIIKNVSESGVGYLMTSSMEEPEPLAPMKTVEIIFKTSSFQIYELSCTVAWFSKTLPYGKTSILGMKIIDPPQSYKDWIKNIS